MNKRKKKIFRYYAQMVALVKRIVNDDELTDEEKIIILATIL